MTEYQKIVFISSYPKSGNTWVRCFIDAYFLQELDINEIVCSVSDDNATRSQIGDGSDISLMPIDIQQLTKPMALLRLVRAYKESGSQVPLFVKTHNAHMIANGIEALPQSLTYGVVHIVRNPLDVLPSFAKHMGIDHEKAFGYMCDKYRSILGHGENKTADFISDWDTHVKSYMNATTHNVLIINYDDMLADPVKEFAKILKHSGVEPDMDRVQAAVDMVALDKLKSQEEKDGFHESSKHAKDEFFGVGGHKGRESLPETMKFKVIRKFERTMKKLGYVAKSKRAA